jgi:hypothetical protein
MRKDGKAVVPPCLSLAQASNRSTRGIGRNPDCLRQHRLRSAFSLAGDLRSAEPVRDLHQVSRSLTRSHSYSSRSRAEYGIVSSHPELSVVNTRAIVMSQTLPWGSTLCSVRTAWEDHVSPCQEPHVDSRPQVVRLDCRVRISMRMNVRIHTQPRISRGLDQRGPRANVTTS